MISLDELSFLNRQLAAMLRDGLPREGALREICQSMGRTELKQELQKLEADLASGMPLVQARPAWRLEKPCPLGWNEFLFVEIDAKPSMPARVEVSLSWVILPAFSHLRRVSM